MKIVSLYADQKPRDDQSQERGKEFGFQVYPIAGALRCGEDKLAVDGVMSIAEHGEYPRNEKGQILYPRYEFFNQIATSSRRIIAAFLSITTSTFPGASRKPNGWWRRPDEWVSTARRFVTARNVATAGSGASLGV